MTFHFHISFSCVFRRYICRVLHLPQGESNGRGGGECRNRSVTLKEYDTWFELIDCEIGVTCELENTILYIKSLWLFVVTSLTTWLVQNIRTTSYTGVFSLANYSWHVWYLHASNFVCLENKVSYLAFHNAWNSGIHALHGIVHFTVACLVAKPFNRSQAKWDFVMIQTLLLFKRTLPCCYAN